MAYKEKSRARRERQRLARLKKIHEMPWKSQRQEFAPPVKVVQPKKGKGAYKRQRFKRGDDGRFFQNEETAFCLGGGLILTNRVCYDKNKVKAITRFPNKIINHYIDVLRERIAIEGVLLFGSFAWGRPTKHSDVDLVVLSSDFAKLKNRLQWLSRARDEITYQVAMDVIGYTPQEFSTIEKKSAIMALAKKKGRWLYKAPSLKL